jgi:hypothetical protein
MTEPITPAEACREAAEKFPPAVYAAFNALIRKHLSRGRAAFLYPEALAAVIQATGLTAAEVERRGLCDVERAYRAAGWEVVYDRRSRDESGEDVYVFKVPKGVIR